MRGSSFGCVILAALLLLSGCSRDIAVSTVLEDTAGLRPGDKVYLDAREVGAVESIEVAGQTPGFKIGVNLDPAHAKLVQQDAVAYVPPESPPMLVLLNPSEVAPPVVPGDRIKGLTPLELAIWQVSDVVGQASSLMEALALRIDSYFESEYWTQTRAEIDEEFSDLAADSRATAERVAEKLERLIESMAEATTDNTSRLGEEVADIEAQIARLEKEGHEEVAESLRHLLERIEAMARPDRGDAQPGTKP